MADNEYPFPASSHEILFRPAPAGIASSFTLGDVISGKAVLNFGNQEFCSCGIVYELPEIVVEMAVKLAQNIPLDTPMIYGLSHIFDETISGLSQEEIADKLREWEDKHDNNNGLTHYQRI